MLQAAIDQLLEWEVGNIQAYCEKITHQAILEILDMGFQVPPKTQRSSHLFGIQLDQRIDKTRLKQAFQEQKVMISFRGNSLRVGPNVYNDAEDLKKLVECLKISIKN